MIKKLHIRNFKTWKDSSEIDLAPITIFCGTNSSGKSSIGQLLLMLKQTIESDDRSKVLNFGDSNSIVNLGGFKDSVFEHKENQKIGFEITFETSQPFTPVDPSKSPKFAKNKYGPYNTIALRCEIGVPHSGDPAAIDEMEYKCIDYSKPVAFMMKRAGNSGYDLQSTGNYQIKKRKNSKRLPPPNKFYGFPAEATAIYSNVDFLPDLSNEMYNLLGNRFFYVGPLRQNPEREYAYTGETPPHVGYKGERAVHALLASRNRKLAFFANKQFGKAKLLERIVAEWLQKMNLIKTFTIEPIAKGRKEHEVKIQINDGSSEVLITDVGFGISQLLPVLVQSLYCQENSTVLFEQPEIHLHPSVQAGLADVFIESRKIKENNKERTTQFIIESHSEHLIRRIQRRIAEETLSPDDVAIYFINQNSGKASIEKIHVDVFGNITNWPPNFFGDDLEDITHTMKASIQRKQKAMTNGKDR